MLREIVLFVILSITINGNLLAGQFEDFDDLDGHIGYWIGLGIGGNYFGVTKSVNLSIAIDDNIFSIRYSKSDEFQFNVEGHYDEPRIGLKEFAILYGKCLKKSIVALTFSTGISYLNGTNRGKNIEPKEYEKINISTLGMPLEFEFIIGFAQNVGIGLQGYYNLNKDKMFGGLIFKLNVGLF